MWYLGLRFFLFFSGVVAKQPCMKKWPMKLQYSDADEMGCCLKQQSTLESLFCVCLALHDFCLLIAVLGSSLHSEISDVGLELRNWALVYITVLMSPWEITGHHGLTFAGPYLFLLVAKELLALNLVNEQINQYISVASLCLSPNLQSSPSLWMSWQYTFSPWSEIVQFPYIRSWILPT